MNETTFSEEATETCTRDGFPIYHSSSSMCSSQKKNVALQVKLIRRITLMRLALQTLPVSSPVSCDWMRMSASH